MSFVAIATLREKGALVLECLPKCCAGSIGKPISARVQAGANRTPKCRRAAARDDGRSTKIGRNTEDCTYEDQRTGQHGQTSNDYVFTDRCRLMLIMIPNAIPIVNSAVPP